MRALWVYQDERLASSRIRVLQMVPFLAQHGVDSECVSYPRKTRRVAQLVRKARDFDIVVLQKKLPSFVDALLWTTLSTPLVYDFDDAVMFRQSPKNGVATSSTRARRFARITKLASGISAGNEWLGGQCKGSRGPVFLVPSPVPFPVAIHVSKGSAKPVIGWIGGRGNLASLDAIAPVLRALALRRDFVLRVICDADYTLDGVHVESVRWSLDTQEAELACFDVGVMPLEDTPWSRGKCAYKLLQYMAAGVLAVGSDVGMNREVIHDGENGLLVAKEADWEAILERALDDGHLRGSLGEAGRATIDEHYSYPALARRWMAVFEALLA